MYDADDRLIVCNSAYGNASLSRTGHAVPGTPYRNARPQRGGARLYRGRQRTGRGVDCRTTGKTQASRASPMSSAAPTARWVQINERKTTEGGTVAVYTNITEIKRAEEEVREAKRKAELGERTREQTEAEPGDLCRRSFRSTCHPRSIRRFSPGSAALRSRRTARS